MPEVLRQVAHQIVEQRGFPNQNERGRPRMPEQELTFDDILDIFNPLQHLPLVSIAYRELTGDEIKPAMRVLGGLAYGGPMGFMSSCAQVLFEAIFGDDVGGTLIGLLDGEEEAPTQRQLAYATFVYGEGTNR